MTSGEGRDVKGSHPPFTDEEIRLMRLWSVSDVSVARQLSAQIAYFATPAVFGVYGLATGSVVILGVAFICILLLLGWGLVSSFRDQRNSMLMQSVCSKVLAALETGEERK